MIILRVNFSRLAINFFRDNEKYVLELSTEKKRLPDIGKPCRWYRDDHNDKSRLDRFEISMIKVGTEHDRDSRLCFGKPVT